MEKRYFKILDTEDTRIIFNGLIGHTCEFVEFIPTCKDRPEYGGSYMLRTVDGDLIFHEDEIEEV